MRLANVDMAFRYADLAPTALSTGYETLLYDCMVGDATLFHRSDMVEAAWSVATPILDMWKALPPRDFPNYTAGSWGPSSALSGGFFSLPHSGRSSCWPRPGAGGRWRPRREALARLKTSPSKPPRLG